MSDHFKKVRRAIVFTILTAFIFTSTNVPAYAQVFTDQMPHLPMPGAMVHLSPEFTPACLKGMIIHPENAFKFDFIIYRGDDASPDTDKKQEYTKLIKYFLASLAVPDEDQWVNLSPYEKDRIIKNDFGKTEMGRDLLAQDYLLKQITASLIYPQDKLGQKFWDEVYAKAYKQFGTINIPVNTFNKVWIVPDDADIYEKGNIAYLYHSHLKVMLEEDYLSLKKHSAISTQGNNPTHSIASQIIRQIVLPQLEREVNEGKNFAPLRQVFSGMVLAAWYKRALRESLLAKIYANKDKVKGVDQDPRNNEIIYQQYLKAFKRGVFNFIREDVDKYTNETIPRKYFSGGWATPQWDAKNGRPGILHRENDHRAEEAASRAMSTEDVIVKASLDPQQLKSRAMTTILFDLRPPFEGPLKDWYDTYLDTWPRNLGIAEASDSVSFRALDRLDRMRADAIGVADKQSAKSFIAVALKFEADQLTTDFDMKNVIRYFVAEAQGDVSTIKQLNGAVWAQTPVLDALKKTLQLQGGASENAAALEGLKQAYANAAMSVVLANSQLVYARSSEKGPLMPSVGDLSLPEILRDKRYEAMSGGERGSIIRHAMREYMEMLDQSTDAAKARKYARATLDQLNTELENSAGVGHFIFGKDTILYSIEEHAIRDGTVIQALIDWMASEPDDAIGDLMTAADIGTNGRVHPDTNEIALLREILIRAGFPDNNPETSAVQRDFGNQPKTVFESIFNETQREELDAFRTNIDFVHEEQFRVMANLLQQGSRRAVGDRIKTILLDLSVTLRRYFVEEDESKRREIVQGFIGSYDSLASMPLYDTKYNENLAGQAMIAKLTQGKVHVMSPEGPLMPSTGEQSLPQILGDKTYEARSDRTTRGSRLKLTIAEYLQKLNQSDVSSALKYAHATLDQLNKELVKSLGAMERPIFGSIEVEEAVYDYRYKKYQEGSSSVQGLLDWIANEPENAISTLMTEAGTGLYAQGDAPHQAALLREILIRAGFRDDNERTMLIERDFGIKKIHLPTAGSEAMTSRQETNDGRIDPEVLRSALERLKGTSSNKIVLNKPPESQTQGVVEERNPLAIMLAKFNRSLRSVFHISVLSATFLGLNVHNASAINHPLPAASSYGGIDLNAFNLNMHIKRDGHGVPLPVRKQDLAQIHLDGLVPVILDIEPAMDSPAFAQIANQAKTLAAVA